MTCKTCGSAVVFGPVGWMHRDSTIACAQLSIAWPPPGSGDDDA
jgi:hypothetical protein